MKEKIKNIDKGILFMLVASFSFSLMGGFAKVLGQTLPSVEVAFFRNIVGLAIISYSIFHTPLKEKGGKPLLLLFRGAMGFLALLAYFYLMANIPLGEAITYNKLSPILVSFFAYIFLKETLKPNVIIALFIGFGGILLVAKPELGFDKYDILGLFSAIGAALAYTSIRELRNYYDTRTIVLSFMGVGTIAPLILMLITPYIEVSKDLDWIFSPFIIPQGIEWLYIIAVGVLATISQLLMTKAYELTKAGIVGTITYTTIVFGLLIGIFLGDPIPSILTFIGILLVILSGVFVTFPFHKFKKAKV